MPAEALIPLVILVVVYVAWLIRDIQRGEVRHLPKWAWMLIVIVSIPLGGIVYLAIGRDR